MDVDVLFVVGDALLLGHNDSGRGVARLGHLLASGVFLSERDGGFAALSDEINVEWLVAGVGQLFIVVVGLVVHPADIHQLEKL